MDLTPFVDQLRRDLIAAAQSGGEASRDAAAALAAAVDPAVRMMLLDALVAAADELTGAVGAIVEVRLRGRDAELVVHAEPVPTENLLPPAPPSVDEAEAGTARVSLRLPEALKVRAERAAAAEGISLNTWLVRAVASATEPGPRVHIVASKGRRITGWVQS